MSEKWIKKWSKKLPRNGRKKAFEKWSKMREIVAEKVSEKFVRKTDKKMVRMRDRKNV